MLHQKRQRELVKEKNQNTRQNKWLRLVLLYAKDAIPELLNIYSRLRSVTGPSPRECVLFSACNQPNVLYDANCVYIYVVRSRIVYGPDALPWPVYDKRLWPWTANERPLPRLPKDVWGLVVRHLNIFDALALARTTTYVRDCVCRDEHWRWRAQAIGAIIPAFDRLLVGKTYYEKFLDFSRLYRRPLDRRAIEMGVHLIVANCIDSSTGWLNQNNWRDTFETEPNPFSFAGYRRFIVFSRQQKVRLIFGQEPKKKNYTLICTEDDTETIWKPEQIMQHIKHMCRFDGNLYPDWINLKSLKRLYPELFQ